MDNKIIRIQNYLNHKFFSVFRVLYDIEVLMMIKYNSNLRPFLHNYDQVNRVVCNDITLKELKVIRILQILHTFYYYLNDYIFYN